MEDNINMPMYSRFGLRIPEVSGFAVAFVIVFLFLLNPSE